MVPEFDKAVFEAPVGKLAPVVRTSYGFHVIRVDSRESTPFEEVKDTLEKKERDAKLQAEITKLIDNAKPVFDPGYFGK
jgi:parvulin-like peptidyl-prolyl isomerase